MHSTNLLNLCHYFSRNICKTSGQSYGQLMNCTAPFARLYSRRRVSAPKKSLLTTYQLKSWRPVSNLDAIFRYHVSFCAWASLLHLEASRVWWCKALFSFRRKKKKVLRYLMFYKLYVEHSWKSFLQIILQNWPRSVCFVICTFCSSQSLFLLQLFGMLNLIQKEEMDQIWTLGGFHTVSISYPNSDQFPQSY